jgi:predicted metal-dependent RNase
MASAIRLHRLGRHQSETDIEVSCGVMDIMKGSKVARRVVIDCGLAPKHAPEGKTWLGPDISLLADGKKIDAVCITHVHGDHVGCLPMLVPYLAPTAKVFMTTTSARMLGPVLRDGININARRKTEGPYNQSQMADIMNRVVRIDRPGEGAVLPDIRALVWPAGHINGACSFTFDVGGYRVHYSGDRCEHDQPGILGATPLPKEWRPQAIAGSDCTYGADPESDSRSWEAEMDRGQSLIAWTLQMHGGPVLICTFGVHRGGAIGHVLQQCGIDDFGPLLLDGACRKFTRIVQDSRSHWCKADQPLTLNYVERVPEGRAGQPFRERILRDSQRYTVIAPPGMGGPGGVVSFWRREILPNPDAAIIFTGYVAPGTDGAKILAAAARRTPGTTVTETFAVEQPDGRIVDEVLPINCQVEQVRLSGHSPRGRIVDWFRDLRPEVAVLNHGSPAALASIEAELKGELPHLSRSDLEPKLEIAL